MTKQVYEGSVMGLRQRGRSRNHEWFVLIDTRKEGGDNLRQ